MNIIDSRNALRTWLCWVGKNDWFPGPVIFESHPQLHFSSLGIGHLRKGVQSEQVAEEIRTRADGTVCKCPPEMFHCFTCGNGVWLPFPFYSMEKRIPLRSFTQFMCFYCSDLVPGWISASSMSWRWWENRISISLMVFLMASSRPPLDARYITVTENGKVKSRLFGWQMWPGVGCHKPKHPFQ